MFFRIAEIAMSIGDCAEMTTTSDRRVKININRFMANI
jgi:hypothetical protein